MRIWCAYQSTYLCSVLTHGLLYYTGVRGSPLLATNIALITGNCESCLVTYQHSVRLLSLLRAAGARLWYWQPRYFFDVIQASGFRTHILWPLAFSLASPTDYCIVYAEFIKCLSRCTACSLIRGAAVRRTPRKWKVSHWQVNTNKSLYWWWFFITAINWCHGNYYYWTRNHEIRLG